MKAFVTGGTGFIGHHVIRKLVERGYEVYALIRSEKNRAKIEALGAQAVFGDITHLDTMREGMIGSDVVFHLAALYQVGVHDNKHIERINVDGTRNVLGLAFELEIPKIIYTSTVGVFGDTKGLLVEEGFVQNEPLNTLYERTKWQAHYDIALPLIELGAPIIIVMPGGVYGPGDSSIFGQLMRYFYQGKLPILSGADTMLTFAHVDDVAEGHVLAAEKGKIGEEYILAGSPVTLKDLTNLWAKLSGKPAPWLNISAKYVRPLAPLFDFIAQKFPLPEFATGEAVCSLGSTYIARSSKAWGRLGWRPRSLEEGLTETLNELAKELNAPTKPAPVMLNRQQKVVGLAVGATLLIFLLWLARKRWGISKK